MTFGREIGEAESHQVLDHAFEHSICFFDTASAYGGGSSEQFIGRWIASRKPDERNLTVATKLLPPYDSSRINEVVQQSLENLGLPAIDLLYLHNWDNSALAPGTLEALSILVDSGSVRALGVSNFNQEQLGAALSFQKENGLARFSALQNNFNYAVRDVDAEYRSFCAREEIAVVTYSPLGAGFLTGKHKRRVEVGSRFDIVPGHQDVYFHDECWERLGRLESLAQKSGIPQTKLALAWAMHTEGVDSVLVGGRTTQQIDQSLAAYAFDDFDLLAQLD